MTANDALSRIILHGKYGDISPAIVADAEAIYAEVSGLKARVSDLESRLAWYVQHYTTATEALRQIQGWDCLNPPQVDLCADFPWLRALVDEALR